MNSALSDFSNRNPDGLVSYAQSLEAEIEQLRTQANERALAWTKYADRLEQELEDQRSTVIEECARVVEMYHKTHDWFELAAAIRALKEKP